MLANKGNPVQFNRSNASGVDENGTPIRGDPPSFFGTGIVSFLDLLGFSRTIKTQWDDSADSPLMRFLRIKQAPIVTEGHQVVVGDYSISTEGVTIPGQAYLTKIHTVSDSITASVALPGDLTIGDFVLAYASIAINLRFFWLSAIQQGFVIRGAVEIGEIYWDSSEIVGPALIDAYYLESKVARTARVIAGPRLLRMVIEVCQRDVYDWQSFLIKSPDGLISLSPVGLLGAGDVEPGEVIEQVKKIRSKCADRPEHSNKYEELLRVLENPDVVVVPSLEDMAECVERLESNAGRP